MAMDAPTAMPTDAALLTLAQWFSPGYPVGAFAYSHGLEWAVEAGDVQDAATLQEWISQVLEFGAGRADGLFLAAAYGAKNASALQEVDTTCRAFAASVERQRETALQGAAFCQVTAQAFGIDIENLCYPVAAGAAARAADLPLEETLVMYLQAFAANLVAAGQRLCPVGQVAGQQILRALAPVIRDIATDAQSGDLDQLCSTTFLADIASMKHEDQYARIFRT